MHPGGLRALRVAHLPTQFRRLWLTPFRPDGVSLPPRRALAGRDSRCRVRRASSPLPLSRRVCGRFAAGQTGGVSRPGGVVSPAVWPSDVSQLVGRAQGHPDATGRPRKCSGSPTLEDSPRGSPTLARRPRSSLGNCWPFASKMPAKLNRTLRVSRRAASRATRRCDGGVSRRGQGAKFRIREARTRPPEAPRGP